MDFKFSAATNGFYPVDSLNDYPDLPGDLVDVSNEQYEALLIAQSRDGKRIVANEDGFPVAADKLPPTLAELQAQRDNLLRQAAEPIAPLQDAVDIDDATEQEKADLLQWKRYRVALSRLDLSVSPVVWPDKPLLQ